LKEESTKSDEDKNDKFIESVLHAFFNVTVGVDENKKTLLDGGIIPLLLPLVDSSNTNIWEKTVHLLRNICCIKSVEDKNSIINCGIFDVFHKKLLEIFPFPPQERIIYDSYSISCIINGIVNLLFSNHSGMTSFLKTPLIPVLLHLLDSTMSAGDIQLYIFYCFYICTEYFY
jgi:hypothetical protein